MFLVALFSSDPLFNKYHLVYVKLHLTSLVTLLFTHMLKSILVFHTPKNIKLYFFKHKKVSIEPKLNITNIINNNKQNYVSHQIIRRNMQKIGHINKSLVC